MCKPQKFSQTDFQLLNYSVIITKSATDAASPFCPHSYHINQSKKTEDFVSHSNFTNNSHDFIPNTVCFSPNILIFCNPALCHSLTSPSLPTNHHGIDLSLSLWYFFLTLKKKLHKKFIGEKLE